MKALDQYPVQLVLASGSPRRLQLLRDLGLRVRALAADIDETPLPGETPVALVSRLAVAKAEFVQRRLAQAAPPDPHASLPVLGSDTEVVIDAQVLGKPRDRSDGVAMLLRLSGRTHEVLTAVALVTGDDVQVVVSRSLVGFRDIAPAEAERYWATGEPRDKAGGYGIQGIGGIFVDRLEGSHTGVMGLPVAETELLLRAAGVDCWRHRGSRGAAATNTGIAGSDHRTLTQ